MKRFLGASSGARVSLVTDPPGFVEAPSIPGVRVCIHAGPPVVAACRHGSAHHRGTVIFGDIDIIPAGTPASWEVKGTDVDLVITIEEDLLRRVARDAGTDPTRLEIRSRFQVRDPSIEHVAWALKAEMESGYPSGGLYLESLVMGLAASLVRQHGADAREPSGLRGAFPARRLRRTMSFIEENLSRQLSLRELAEVAGLSVSHLTVLFRRATGVSVHQYVLRRRVDRAADLLRGGTLPINRVALEVGFCHQSHLALHMRRILGLAPRDIRDTTS